MMRKIQIALIGLLIFNQAYSQDGGSSVYSFLEIPASARVAAMGGTYITVKDNDINCALQAPSLLNSSMSNSLSFSGVSYMDGIKFGDAIYVHDVKNWGTYMASMHYAAYGQFLETNEYGDIIGTFHSSDYAFTIGGGYQFNQLFSFGANIKAIYSDYYIYNSFGLATDLSATLNDTNKRITATFLIRNVGAQLDSYTATGTEALPAEAIIGFSKRLQKAPLRFNIIYRHMEKFDLSYVDPLNVGDADPLTGEPTIKEYGFWNKLSRHFILGTEILLSKNFHIRGAYNFQRRQELKVDTRPGLTGFSLGVGLKISKFIIGWGLGEYHVAGAANHFSITTNLSEFGKKSSE
jgi:hypothetical protein